MAPFLHGNARVAFAAGILLCAASGLAHADVIDGNWCSADGRHFSIRGSTIVTPGGTKTEGNYSPHHFAYIVPPADAAAGTPICIMLVDEVTVHVHPEHVAAGTNEVWKRCDVTSQVVSPAPAKPVN